MAWDGVERRVLKHGATPVTNDDLDEALAVHSQQERAYVENLLEELMRAFPDGVEKHRDYHESKIQAAKAEKEFWDTAKKAVITNGISGLFGLVKIILVLAALGLTAKFTFPTWAATFITGGK